MPGSLERGFRPEGSMRETQAERRVEKPAQEQSVETRRQPSAQVEQVLPKAEALHDVGLFDADTLDIEVIPSPRRVVETLPLSQEQSDDDTLDDIDFKPSLIQRLAKNSLARGLFRAIGLLGSAEGMRQGVEAYQELERQAEVQQEIVSVAYESSFDVADDGIEFKHQIDPEHTTVTFDDGDQLTGREVLDALNTGMTNWANESYKGLWGIVDDGIAETSLPDGKTGIDVMKLEMAYGDQFKSFGLASAERVDLVTRAAGLEAEEFDVISKVYRNGVFERPDAAMGGVAGLSIHNADQYNLHNAPEGTSSAEIHQQRAEEALKLTTEIVRSLEVDEMSTEERSQLVESLQEAIQKTIEADNAWTQAAGYTDNWDEDVVKKGFTETVPNTIDPGSESGPMYTRLVEANQAADFAWRKVAAFEDSKDGQVHDISEAVRKSLDAKAEVFFQKAIELDPSSVAFQRGLQDFGETVNIAGETPNPLAETRDQAG